MTAPVPSRDVGAQPSFPRHSERWTQWGYPDRQPPGPVVAVPDCAACDHPGHDVLCPVLVPHPDRPTASLCPCGTEAQGG